MSGNVPFNACLANPFNCALVALVALMGFVIVSTPVNIALRQLTLKLASAATQA
jgi:hypothetical protein